MTDVRNLFADIAAAIEDLHGIAVEGQAPNMSPDIQSFLLTAIAAGLMSITATVTRASTAIADLQS